MNKNEFLDLEVGSDVVSYQSNNIFNILEFSENAQKIKMKRWKDSKVFSYSQLYFLKQFCVSEITTAETCWNTYAKAVGGKTFDGTCCLLKLLSLYPNGG